MSGVWRGVLVTLGSFSLVMGVIGVFLPMWPTTPFLLLSAACYIRSSERLYRWLLDHPHLGAYVGDFLSGKGIALRAKITMLVAMWATTVFSSGLMLVRFGASPFALSYAASLTLIGVGVHYYIGYRIPTRVETGAADDSDSAPARP